jgi:hypothetical protein
MIDWVGLPPATEAASSNEATGTAEVSAMAFTSATDPGGNKHMRPD